MREPFTFVGKSKKLVPMSSICRGSGRPADSVRRRDADWKYIGTCPTCGRVGVLTNDQNVRTHKPSVVAD